MSCEAILPGLPVCWIAKLGKAASDRPEGIVLADILDGDPTKRREPVDAPSWFRLSRGPF